MNVRRVALGDLSPDPANARKHGGENLAAIEASLKRFGQAEPLVVHKPTGRIIGGNGRFTAMKKLGWTEADVVELEIDELAATALGIALNRSGDLAGWDEEALGALLLELQRQDALDGVGFDDAAIDELLADLGGLEEPGELDDPGPDALPEKPVTRPGDLWVLGEHRLLCGDSREAESYTRLLGGERADIVWTDPPYGVRYVGKTADALQIENDHLEGGELEEFLGLALGATNTVCRPGAVWYVAAPAGPNFLPFALVLTHLGVWRQTLTWVKDAFVLGRSDWHYKHEAIFYGWTPGVAHQAPPSRDGDTVWEVARPKASPDHPTTKPVELVTRALLANSNPGDIVLDPFAGSGTTLVAAESTGRKACVIELDPRYCDVVIRRWEEATGRHATLDGKTSAQVADKRSGDEEDPE